MASRIDTYVEVGLQRNVRSTSLYVLYLGVLRVERRTVRRDRHYVAMDRGEIGVCVRGSMYCSSTISLEDVMKRTGSVCLYGYTSNVLRAALLGRWLAVTTYCWLMLRSEGAGSL